MTILPDLPPTEDIAVIAQELRRREAAAIIANATARVNAINSTLLDDLDELLLRHKAQINVEADHLTAEGFADIGAAFISDNLGGTIFSAPTVAGALRSIVDGAQDAYEPYPTPVTVQVAA